MLSSASSPHNGGVICYEEVFGDDPRLSYTPCTSNVWSATDLAKVKVIENKVNKKQVTCHWT